MDECISRFRGGKVNHYGIVFPKWDQLDWLDTSYTLTLSAIIDQSDYLPMTNPQLLDEIDPKKQKKKYMYYNFCRCAIISFLYNFIHDIIKVFSKLTIK